MRKVALLSVLVVGCCLAGSLAFSRAGMLDCPTATVPLHTQVVVGGSFTAYSFEVADTASADTTSESDFAIAGHLDVGLFDRGMIGATYLGDGGISGNVRFLVFGETITRPGIAVGAENLIGEENYEFWSDGEGNLYDYGESQNLSAYVVLTKNFDYFTGAPFCVNLGWGLGRFQQKEQNSPEGFVNPVPGLFLGFEYHPSLVTSVALEWDGRDANLGGSYTMNEYVRFMGSISELEQLIRSGEEVDRTDVMQNVKFTLGVEFTVGPFGSKTHLDPFQRLGEREHNEEALHKLEEARSQAREKIRELEESITD
ncbi:hypothetical protein GF402_06760 [Candidatus Fermentibacteria bacterium]|nr:hypothetical protein [Candidatus Fermentibacteria bacterium]